MSEENAEQPTAPKRRGRPPKAKEEAVAKTEAAAAPKKRGRPAAKPKEEAVAKADAPAKKSAPKAKESAPAPKTKEAAPAAKTEATKPSSNAPAAEKPANAEKSDKAVEAKDNNSGASKENSDAKQAGSSEQNTQNNNNQNRHNNNQNRHNNNQNRNNNNNQNRNNKNWKNNKNRNRNNNRKRSPYHEQDMMIEEEEAAFEGGTPGANLSEIQQKSMPELNELANSLEIEGVGSIGKQQLVYQILQAQASDQGILYGGGVLEVCKEGYGFLRSSEYSYMPSPEDIYLSPKQVKRFSLRTGDSVMGAVRAAQDQERFFAMIKVDAINGEDPKEKKNKIPFESLTPDFPEYRMHMETTPTNLSMRILDLVLPVGAGQRGLIVAPPRTGKTVLMQSIANSIATNNPDFHLIVLLIDERPEEVTDMKRNVKGEVISSTFDEPPSRHVQVAEMVIEKAKRMVEHGKNVVVLLDSITRLARAYNTVQPHSGKILSGGVDANALHKPKRFFGAARRVQEGGSLTILATALVDTGSKMDEVIFEEFKGTGNMEICLDRSMIDKRIFPAINIEKSGARKEELLLDPKEKELMWKLRRAVIAMPPAEGMKIILNGAKKTKSNVEFLMTMNI